MQGGLRRDHAHGTGFTVGELVRDDELVIPARRQGNNEGARHWPAEIADEEKRKLAQQNVLPQWIAEDAAAAEAWAKQKGVVLPALPLTR